MKRVDARGLSCPEPVIQTKNAMASKEEQGDDFLLKITK